MTVHAGPARKGGSCSRLMARPAGAIMMLPARRDAHCWAVSRTAEKLRSGFGSLRSGEGYLFVPGYASPGPVRAGAQ